MEGAPLKLDLSSFPQNKMTTDEINDYKKFYVEGGVDGFSPAYNQSVIENTIKQYEAYRATKKKMEREALKERSSAVADYLFSGKEDVDKYFGKKTLAYLRGEDIANRLQGNLFGNNKLYTGIN